MRLPRAVNFSMGAVGAAMAATLAGRVGALSHHTSIVLDPRYGAALTANGAKALWLSSRKGLSHEAAEGRERVASVRPEH